MLWLGSDALTPFGEDAVKNHSSRCADSPGHALLFVAVGLATMLGCSRSDSARPADPATFRADVEFLIEARDYRGAIAQLKRVNPAELAACEESGYLAVGEDMIVLPGVDAKIRYDENRDWFLPGTSDCVEDMPWQRAATEFARQYNEHRSGE